MNLLSLCSGIGGLDRAVERMFAADLVAYAELDNDAASIMAEHWPGVPNLSDLKTADWEPWAGVDIVCGGIPCQPWSSAGKLQRTEDDRHLWPYVADALRVLRPRFLVLEEVPGFLARGGLDAVLADLCALGFDAEWVTVRASDVGACHRRERLFLLAWDATRHDGRDVCLPRCGQQGRDAGALGESNSSIADVGVRRLPTPMARNGDNRGMPSTDLARRRVDAGKFYLEDVVALLPTPTKGDGTGGGFVGNPDAMHKARGDGGASSLRDVALTASAHDLWGDYAASIARHEGIACRDAPTPLDGKRLSPDFVEWMMMFPAGWTASLKRTARLRCLGNAVVTHQAELALSVLLERAFGDQPAQQRA